MNGLCLASIVILDGLRARYNGRSMLQDNFQALLIFETTFKLKEGAAKSEYQHCRAGERRPR